MQEEEPGVSPDIPWDLCGISWQWLALVFLAHHFLAGLGLERLVHPLGQGDAGPNEHCDLLGIKGGAKQPLVTPLPAEMDLGWFLLFLGGTDSSKGHKPARHRAEHWPVGQISLNMGVFKQLVPGTSKGTLSYKSLLKIFILLPPPSASSPGGAGRLEWPLARTGAFKTGFVCAQSRKSPG